MKGGFFTVRGAGTPVRPPAVWVNVTDDAVTFGSLTIVGYETPANVASRPARRSVVEPMAPHSSWPWPVGEAEPIGGPQRFEVFDDVGRRVVVMGDAHRERHLRHALDRFGGNPGDRRDF